MNAKEQQPSAVDITGDYITTFDYDVDGNPIYIGKSDVGTLKSLPLWQIRKLTYSSGNLVDIQYADGDRNFDNIWDNRVTLSYS